MGVDGVWCKEIFCGRFDEVARLLSSFFYQLSIDEVEYHAFRKLECV